MFYIREDFVLKLFEKSMHMKTKRIKDFLLFIKFYTKNGVFPSSLKTFTFFRLRCRYLSFFSYSRDSFVSLRACPNVSLHPAVIRRWLSSHQHRPWMLRVCLNMSSWSSDIIVVVS